MPLGAPGEPGLAQHRGRRVLLGERVGDDDGHPGGAGAADELVDDRRGEAPALSLGRDGVAELDLAVGGRAVEPAEADEGAVDVEEQVGAHGSSGCRRAPSIATGNDSGKPIQPATTGMPNRAVKTSSPSASASSHSTRAGSTSATTGSWVTALAPHPPSFGPLLDRAGRCNRTDPPGACRPRLRTTRSTIHTASGLMPSTNRSSSGRCRSAIAMLMTLSSSSSPRAMNCVTGHPLARTSPGSRWRLGAITWTLSTWGWRGDREAAGGDAEGDTDGVPGDARGTADVADEADDDGDLDDGADAAEQRAAQVLASSGDGHTPLPERDLDEHEGHDQERFHGAERCPTT